MQKANCFKERYSNDIFGDIFEESPFVRSFAGVSFHFDNKSPKKILE